MLEKFLRQFCATMSHPYEDFKNKPLLSYFYNTRKILDPINLIKPNPSCQGSLQSPHTMNNELSMEP
jgi:hypothetical protein